MSYVSHFRLSTLKHLEAEVSAQEAHPTDLTNQIFHSQLQGIRHVQHGYLPAVCPSFIASCFI